MKSTHLGYESLLLLTLGSMGCGGSAVPFPGVGRPQAQALSLDPSGPGGVDVSHWDGSIDWDQVAASGQTFAYVKATEGTTYRSPSFTAQYDGSAAAGLIRGSYHFAHPNSSSGNAQATYFVTHGGGWSADGATLPGCLDIEYNPSGSSCYGLSTDEMVAWIHDFADTYNSLTGRDAVIYTTTDWWNACTGGSTEFSANPLWIAQYGVASPNMPDGWSDYALWQYTDSGDVSGIPTKADVNVFSGDSTQLAAFATGP